MVVPTASPVSGMAALTVVPTREALAYAVAAVPTVEQMVEQTAVPTAAQTAGPTVEQTAVPMVEQMAVPMVEQMAGLTAAQTVELTAAQMVVPTVVLPAEA
jgi:hypothetical protein